MRAGNRMRRAGTGAALALVLALASPVSAAVAEVTPEPTEPVATATASTASLEVTTDVTEVAPGGTVVYTLSAGCESSADLGCRNAEISDTVPAPLVIVDVRVVDRVSPAESGLIVGNAYTLAWRTPLGDGTVGILAGDTRAVRITARLPSDVPSEVFGIPIADDALLQGDNFPAVSAHADITPVATKPTEPPYDGPVGSLTIVKSVTGPGAPYFSGGPFRAHVHCTLAGADGVTSVVYDKNVWFGENRPFRYRATLADIPSDAVCAVTEPDDGLADGHEIQGSPVTIGDGTEVTVTIVNTFLVGSLRVDKRVVGAGADMYGTARFTITVRCMELLSWRYVDIPGGATRTLDAAGGWGVVYDTLPGDAWCDIEETDDGGADASRLIDPNGYDHYFHDGGSFVGFFPIEAGSQVVYTIENTFDAALPATGADVGMLWAAGALALVLIGGGALVVVAVRRNRG